MTTFFLAAWLLQIFYYLFFFDKLARFVSVKKTENEPNEPNASLLAIAETKNKQATNLQPPPPPVSVIICAKNEACNLAAFLPTVLAQVYPIFEVIVVNDDSSDNTEAVLHSLQQQYAADRLRVISTKGRARTMAGKKFALSVGIAAAKYDCLLLTDADCRPKSVHWIGQMVSNFSDKIDIVLGYSPYFATNSLLNKIIQFETFHTAMQYLSYCIVGIPYMGVGRNLAYRKKLHGQAKGFESHGDLASGDDDLFINQVANRQNCTIEITPNSTCFSAPPTTWKAWYKQKTRHISAGKRYRVRHKMLLGLYILSHFVFYGTFIVVLLQKQVVILLFFFIRLTIQTCIYYRLQKKLCVQIRLYEMILLDALFAFYPLIFINTNPKKQTRSWK